MKYELEHVRKYIDARGYIDGTFETTIMQSDSYAELEAMANKVRLKNGKTFFEELHILVLSADGNNIEVNDCIRESKVIGE